MKSGFEIRSVRASRLRLVGVGLMVVALVALAAERADAGSMYVHSASSGTFAGGRLTLRGVGRTVRWHTTRGRTGVAPITFAQKRVFIHGMRPTGILHIAGKRGGEKFAFRLSDPRYRKARRTVSYRAMRRANGVGGAKAAAAVPRRFGAVSLSVVLASPRGKGLGAPLGSVNGGNDCEVTVVNGTDIFARVKGNPIQLTSASQWPTDNWAEPPSNDLSYGGGESDFVSAGGLWRGCADTTVWSFTPECVVGRGCGPSGTFTASIEWDWGSLPTTSCTSSNPDFKCVRDTRIPSLIVYDFVPA